MKKNMYASVSIEEALTIAQQHQQAGQWQQAESFYQQILSIRPNYVEAHSNLGSLMAEQEHWQQAEFHLQRAIELNPLFAEAYNNMGLLCKYQGDLKRAQSYYRKAIILQPAYSHAHWNLGLLHLLIGNYPEGFREYEWRWKTASFTPRQFSQPMWKGQSLNGKKLFIHVEQGFGDHIQLVRFIPMVVQRGGVIFLECHPALIRLFQKLPYLSQLVVEGGPLPEFDYYLPLGSLPYMLGIIPETIPRQVPYLAPIQSTSLPPSIVSCPLKVGLVWVSYSKVGKKKSCAFSDFLDILNVPGITFYSLQEGLIQEEAEIIQQKSNLIDLGNYLTDFAETAAMIEQLDLVISIDTACAHLAGALGKPVWILLQFAADWRWQEKGEESWWYPTARLFRQNRPSDWRSALKQIHKALILWKSNH